MQTSTAVSDHRLRRLHNLSTRELITESKECCWYGFPSIPPLTEVAKQYLTLVVIDRKLPLVSRAALSGLLHQQVQFICFLPTAPFQGMNFDGSAIPSSTFKGLKALQFHFAAHWNLFIYFFPLVQMVQFTQLSHYWPKLCAVQQVLFGSNLSESVPREQPASLMGIKP